MYKTVPKWYKMYIFYHFLQIFRIEKLFFTSGTLHMHNLEGLGLFLIPLCLPLSITWMISFTTPSPNSLILNQHLKGANPRHLPKLQMSEPPNHLQVQELLPKLLCQMFHQMTTLLKNPIFGQRS